MTRKQRRLCLHYLQYYAKVYKMTDVYAPYFRFPNAENKSGLWTEVRHNDGFSVVYGGIACGNVDLRFGSMDEAQDNRTALIGILGDVAGTKITASSFIAPQLSNSILTVGPEGSPLDLKCDGLITEEPGIALSLNTADCLQLVIAGTTKRRRALGVIHVGRQGYDQDIHQKAFNIFEQDLRIDPTNVSIFVGPSIRAKSYRFSYNLVRQYFPKYLSDFPNIVKGYANQSDEDGLYEVDILGKTLADLIDRGLQIGKITISQVDVGIVDPSCLSYNKFYSHSREMKKPQSERVVGRNPLAAVIH
jgi:copper oxidase (laccase) domain-containing protein